MQNLRKLICPSCRDTTKHEHMSTDEATQMHRYKCLKCGYSQMVRMSGAKKKPDKKRMVRFFIEGSVIDRNGGIDNSIENCKDALKKGV